TVQAPRYSGTVQLPRSDRQAVLPANYTVTAADAGYHIFSGLTALKTVGNQTLTVTDTVTNSMAGIQTGITVSPAAPTSLSLTAPASSPSGGAFSVIVTAKDPYGNTATGYTGTVHFTSSDGSVTLPANYTFVSANQGVHTFSNGVTLTTSGAQSVTATDTGNGSITGASTVQVGGAGLPTSPTNLSATAVSIGQINLAWTNNSNNQTGFKIERSPDGVTFAQIATVGSNVTSYSDTGSSAGARYYYRVRATNGTGDSSYSNVANAMARGAAVQFLVSASTYLYAGSTYSVTVTALDSFNDPASGYTGTVHFTSTDGQASLPANYTFTNTDAGSHTFSNVLFKIAGTQSLTVTDTSNGSIAGTQAGIGIRPGSSVSYKVNG